MEEPKSTAKRRAKTAASAQEDKITLLPLSELHDFPNHPFKVRDDEAMQETAESIRQYGVLQPLTVRKAGGAYELVAGERRLRAARLAGLTEVPCLLADVDEEASGMLALVENLQRRDLDYICLLYTSPSPRDA